MIRTERPLMLIGGNSNPALWEEVSQNLGLPLTKCTVSRFSDGEVRVKIDESVRDAYCFILQSTCAPVNDNLMELLLIIDALHRASAYRIGVVTPYYGYARQDKKLAPREPISARLVANLIEQTGASRVLAMDLHSNAIQGFFNIPVDHLTAANELCDYMFSDGWAEQGDCVVVSPDVGGVERASYVADRLNLPIAIIAKRRPEPNVAEVIEVVGHVKGKRCILFDDMIDTAGSLKAGATRLMESGATAVRAYATHGIFSGNAVQNVLESPVELMTVTNTIPQRDATNVERIRYISVARLIAEAIRRNYMGMSISSLFR
ncbi:ribose-phosphate pyrophosphokinase [bacterium]|nr:ribose-phosphate pyrophosphokinase [bacterium]